MIKHEKISYVEFPSRDLEKTKQFFQQVFNWKFTDYGPDYTAFDDEFISGGFFRTEQSSKTENGAALVVFYSAMLEETQEKIIQANGSIVKPIFHFPGGRRFHFCEPCGNEFAVWSDFDKE
ncbi:MAG: VOC family protein [Gammaproteobacteria bacterium]|nr:VOC family protein [Gammaproteobacteria bacterium]